MATFLSDNIAYVEVAGNDISDSCVDAELSPSADNNETTAGFGIEYKEREGGLKDVEFKVSRAVKLSDIDQTMIDADIGEKFAVVYGIKGNATGDPKFAMVMVLDDVGGMKREVTGGLTVLEYSYSGAEQPTATPWAGDKF